MYICIIQTYIRDQHVYVTLAAENKDFAQIRPEITNRKTAFYRKFRPKQLLKQKFTNDELFTTHYCYYYYFNICMPMDNVDVFICLHFISCFRPIWSLSFKIRSTKCLPEIKTSPPLGILSEIIPGSDKLYIVYIYIGTRIMCPRRQNTRSNKLLSNFSAWKRNRRNTV